MKNVKKLFLMLVAIAIAVFSSCNNEGTDPVLEEDVAVAAVVADVVEASAFGDSDMSAWTEIEEANLPQSVLDYIADNYSGDTVHHAWVDDNGGYVVLLDSRTALRFDNSGVFVEAIENAGKGKGHDRPELTEVDIANLPSSITDYITANYGDYTIDEAGTDAEGNYHVKLEDGPVLIFDAEGNFIEVKERREGRGKKDGRRGGDHEDRWTAVDLADLPASITDYVSANYPDATISHVGTDAEGNYGVVLDSNVVLIFDAEGNFVEEKESHDHDGKCEDSDDDENEEDGE